ncbi:MAG: hypothetical protein NC302_11760 [Bacteroidales bacterium]|nr:hypothetical protein [Bacteroidales bacterium]
MYNRKMRLRAISLMCVALLLAGCGAADNAEEAAPVETAENEDMASSDDAETSAEAESEETGKQAAEDLTPDPTNLEYLAEYQVAELYGDGKEYPVYAPKGGDNTNGNFYYDDHGITFTASAYTCEYPEYAEELLQISLDTTVDLKVQDWQNDPACSNVGVGEILEKGDDRYLFLTTDKEAYDGAVYQQKMIIYMSVRENGDTVFWDMEVRENGRDEETAPLIAEVARCYGLNLSELSMEDGTWAEQEEAINRERQNNYEPEEGETVVEEVEGYQYLGMVTIAMDADRKETCPVLVPRGASTSVYEDRVLAGMHGASVWVSGYETPNVWNMRAMAQREADWDQTHYNNEESGRRNGTVSELMPMQGQDTAVYYVVEYEEKDNKTEDYYPRTYVNCLIPVTEKCYIDCEITLRSEEYDVETNDLLKELETAYGIDLSAWYAE